MRLLVAVDFFEDSPQRILAAVTPLAHAAAASVVLLHVAEPEPDFVGFSAGSEALQEQIVNAFRKEHDALQALAAELRTHGVETTAVLTQGPTAATILAEAEGKRADVVVVGTHSRNSVMEMLVGSVSHAVLRNSKLPVLLVPVRKN